MKCSSCQSESTVKNGHTHYGKQKYQCKDCRRQFVEGGAEWFVTEADKALIDSLLLERISLRGICRVCHVSLPWLLAYLKELYARLPDDLNADLRMPPLAPYLDERLAEEVARLQAANKDTAAWHAYHHPMEEEPAETEDPEPVCAPEVLSEIALENDLLMNELYEKERGLRVEFFGVQLDELWSFVQKKAVKQWVWLALNPANRQVVALHVGDRGRAGAEGLYAQLPAVFKGAAGFFSDYWAAYRPVFAEEDHFGVGKASGLTAYIERFNGTLRQRVSRLVRKSLSFSKSLENRIGAIKYFICNYNLTRQSLQF